MDVNSAVILIIGLVNILAVLNQMRLSDRITRLSEEIRYFHATVAQLDDEIAQLRAFSNEEEG